MNTDGPAITHMRRPQPRDKFDRPACYGDPRFTTTDPVDVAAALAICGDCKIRSCVPILAEISKTSTGRHTLEGVWDGAYYSPNTTGKWVS